MKHSTGINQTFDAGSHNIVGIVLGKDPVCLCHRLEKVELINRLAIKNIEKMFENKKNVSAAESDHLQKALSMCVILLS